MSFQVVMISYRLLCKKQQDGKMESIGLVKKFIGRTSLVVQRLGLRASKAGGSGSITVQVTKIPHAVWCSQKKLILRNGEYQQNCGSFPEMCVLVTQLCPILCNPMDCSPSGSSVHGIPQARILEWVAIPFSGGVS